jgi:hypothetical protein
MTIPHLKERIEYAREELAWLERGAKEGEEPWREWQCANANASLQGWDMCSWEPEWHYYLLYRRRPKMLHVIDAKGVRHEFPVPMRDEPPLQTIYWFVGLVSGGIGRDSWGGLFFEHNALKSGLCQATEEGAQQQLAALRAVCLGGKQ